MINKASGRSASILVAGLVVLSAGPATATDGDDSTSVATSNSQAAPVTRHGTYRHALHHRRHDAHRKVHPITNAVDETADDEKAAAPAIAATGNKVLAQIPPAIANANAQMLLAGAQFSAATAIPPGTDASATTFDTANADKQIVVAASDQLSDADRTLQEGAPTTAATPNPPPAPEPATTMTGESSAWRQSSLIGKVFIGFGALLTMASAARMFIS